MAAPEFSLRDVDSPFGPVRIVSFTIPGGVTTSEEFSAAVEKLEGRLAGSFGIVLDGRGPIWGYLLLAHGAHAARFLAAHDPRLDGAVVVQSHVEGLRPGAILEISGL